MKRYALSDFDLANPIYAGATVTVWKVDVDTFLASDFEATLYAGLTGTTQLTNPQTLDGSGKWARHPYCVESVILEIEVPGGPEHSTSIIQRPGYPRGDWATAEEYWPGDTVQAGTANNIYQCMVPHTAAATFAADLSADKWAILVDASELAGVQEAPEDGTPYGREDADWVAVASDERMTAAEDAIAALSGEVAWIGTYDATAHTADYTPESGLSDGVLVAASAAPNKYLLVTTAGTGAAPAPVSAFSVGDRVQSNGTAWYKVATSAASLAASQVTVSAISGIAATDAQAAIAELKAELDAEVIARAADVDAEQTARIADVDAEQTAREAADVALQADVDAKIEDAASDGVTYGRRNGAWAAVVAKRVRTVSGTTDTPTTADADGIIFFTSASAITLTANDLGAGVTYSIQQRGAGQVTVAAGSGVTRVSDKASASYVTARRGAWLTVSCDGNGNVFVAGNTG